MIDPSGLSLSLKPNKSDEEGRRGSDEERRRREDENEGNDSAEELEVDGASFLSADSLAALELIGEFQQRHRENQLRDRRNEDNDPNDDHALAAARDPRVPVNGGPAPDGDGVINMTGPPVVADIPDADGILDVAGRSDQPGFLIIGSNGGPRGRGRVLYFGSPGTRRAHPTKIPKNARIHQNTKGLTHYIKESNTGRGFIKEQCFSPDGRFIASPYGYGVRLLGWDNKGSDLASCVSATPTELCEIGDKMSHNEVVLSSAFSPAHWLLVTGCLSGRIVWHQPVL